MSFVLKCRLLISNWGEKKVKTMEIKGQKIPQVSHKAINFFLTSCLRVGWKVMTIRNGKSQFRGMTRPPHPACQWFTELDSNWEREILANPALEKGDIALVAGNEKQDQWGERICRDSNRSWLPKWSPWAHSGWTAEEKGEEIGQVGWNPPCCQSMAETPGTRTDRLCPKFHVRMRL